MKFHSHLFQIKPGMETVWMAWCDKLNETLALACEGLGEAKRRVVLTNYSVDGVSYCFGAGESLDAPSKDAATNKQHVELSSDCLDLVPIESAIFSIAGNDQLFRSGVDPLHLIPLSSQSNVTEPRYWLFPVKHEKVEAWNCWCREANKITAQECQSPYDALKRTVFTCYRQDEGWVTLCRTLDLDRPTKNSRMNREFQELRAECTDKPAECHFQQMYF